MTAPSSIPQSAFRRDGGGAQQADFDFIVGHQHRQLLTIKETSGILRLNKDSVIILGDKQKLEWHEFSIGGESNLSRRITRRSVVTHLGETANYRPGDWADSLLSLVRGIKDPALRARIHQASL